MYADRGRSRASGARPKVRSSGPDTMMELSEPMQCLDDVHQNESLSDIRRASLNPPHNRYSKSREWGSDPGLVDPSWNKKLLRDKLRFKDTNRHNQRSSYHGISEERDTGLDDNYRKRDKLSRASVGCSPVYENYAMRLGPELVNPTNVDRTGTGQRSPTHVDLGRKLRDQLQIDMDDDAVYKQHRVETEDQYKDEELLPNDSPQFDRNDSLEHLHDDVPNESPRDVLYDDIYVGEGEAERTMQPSTLRSETNDLMRDLTAPHMEERNNRVSPPTEIENRYRPTGSQGHPRPLNIERNQHEDHGASARSYDNTGHNINLNTSSEKFKSDISRPENIPILNNDPLVGNKTIPSKNIYHDEETAVRVPPSDRSRNQEVRTCPICNDDFLASALLEDIERHTAECGVTPSSPEEAERVCPMCNSIFPDTVSQREFETHVNDHFADDFEVLTS